MRKFMNKKTNVLIALSLGLILGASTIEARGGGGGGRGGYGGGDRGGYGGDRGGYSGGDRGRSYEGGNSFNRSPSMSRSSSYHPDEFANDRSRYGNQSFDQDRRYGNYRPEEGNFAERPATSAQLSQFMQQNKFGGEGRNLQPNLQNVANARPNQANLSNIDPNNVRSALNQNHPDYRNWFNDGFFNQHNYHPAYAANTAANLWRGANWAAASNWLGAGWDNPIYYGDDDGSYGTPSPAPTPYNETTTNIFNAPQSNPVPSNVPSDQTTSNIFGSGQSGSQDNQQVTPNGDWLPLGVFALGKDANTLANASMFLQLALNKNGTIAGTYYNTLTNATFQTEGLVDKQSQVAAIQMSNNPSSPILKTGIYNLTKDQTPVTVYFPDGSQQTWSMVRVQQ